MVSIELVCHAIDCRRAWSYLRRCTRLLCCTALFSHGHLALLYGRFLLHPSTLHHGRPVYNHGKFSLYYRSKFGWAVSTEVGAEPGDLYTKSTAQLPGGITGKWYVTHRRADPNAPTPCLTSPIAARVCVRQVRQSCRVLRCVGKRVNAPATVGIRVVAARVGQTRYSAVRSNWDVPRV